MTAVAHAAFTVWLRAQMQELGCTTPKLAAASGVKDWTVRRILRGNGGPSEANARAIADALGADPDRAAALAGYVDQAAAVPDVGAFPTTAAWVGAVLIARQESPEHASEAIGRSRGCLRPLVERGFVGEPATLRAFAAYVGADPQLVLTRLAEDRKHSDRGRRGQVTREERHGPVQLDAWRRLAWDARRRRAEERGSRFVSEASRAAAIETMRVAAKRRGRRPFETMLARHGADRVHEMYLARGARRRTRIELPCAICGKPLERTLSQVRRRRSAFHQECYFSLLRSPEERERSRKVLRAGRAIRVLQSRDVDPAYRQEELRRARLQIAELRKDAKPAFKKRTTFDRDLDIAEAAVRLKDHEDRSYYEVAKLLFVADPAPGGERGEPTLSEIRRAMEAVRRGRVLRLGGTASADASARIASKSRKRNARYRLDSEHSA